MGSTLKGRGYPPKIFNKRAFLVDFLPLHKRTLHRHGFTLDYVHYYSNTLAPLIADRRKYDSFLIRRDPRDLSRIYVLDPNSQRYLEIPYRTLSHPAVTLWEQRQAIKNLHEKGMAKVDEAVIFKAIDNMRAMVRKALNTSKAVRRNNERKKLYTLLPNRDSYLIAHDDEKMSALISKEALVNVQPFEDIELWQKKT